MSKRDVIIEEANARIEKLLSERDRKIKKINDEYLLEVSIIENLKNIKVTSYVDDCVPRIIAKCKSFEEAKTVLSAYPSTNERTLITLSSVKKYIESKYRLDIPNPAEVNTFEYYKIKVSYQSDYVQITIELPIELLGDAIEESVRGLYSSEYHYFPGTSQTKLNRMSVRSHYFHGDQIGWWGGSKTSTDVDEINKIMNLITK